MASLLIKAVFCIPSNKRLNYKEHTDPLYATVEGKRNLRKYWNFPLKSLFMLLSDTKGKSMVWIETKEVKRVVESACPHMEVGRNGVLIWRQWCWESHSYKEWFFISRFYLCWKASQVFHFWVLGSHSLLTADMSKFVFRIHGCSIGLPSWYPSIPYWCSLYLKILR